MYVHAHGLSSSKTLHNVSEIIFVLGKKNNKHCGWKLYLFEKERGRERERKRERESIECGGIHLFCTLLLSYFITNLFVIGLLLA